MYFTIVHLCNSNDIHFIGQVNNIGWAQKQVETYLKDCYHSTDKDWVQVPYRPQIISKNFYNKDKHIIAKAYIYNEDY